MMETTRHLFSNALRTGAISLAVIAGATASAAELMPKGFDKVVKQAETAFEQTNMAETQLKSALEACSALVDGKSEASLERVKDSVKDSRKQVDVLKSAIKHMEDDSTDYFTKWERSVLNLDGIDRTTAEDMRSEYWNLFHKVSEDAVDSENELQPLLKDLDQLVGKLEHQAADSSSANKTELAEVARKADAWFSDVDQRQKDAKEVIQELTGR